MSGSTQPQPGGKPVHDETDERAASTMTGGWRQYPDIDLPAPVPALLAAPDGVWAGGVGGLARSTGEGGWRPPSAGLPLRSVTALAESEGVLLAAGDGGIARSADGGQRWRDCLLPEGVGPITALALSPHFGQDGMALTATLAGGMLRSADGGMRWRDVNFGLSSREVLALLWLAGETVLAATADGICQSPNAGRAWRACPGTRDEVWVALAALDDGTFLAAPEVGPPRRAPGPQGPWTPLGGLPGDIRVSSLAALGAGAILLGTADHGLLRSGDGGVSWAAVSSEATLCLAPGAGRVYAGTARGVMVGDDCGKTWTALSAPPLHDYRQLLIVEGRPLIAGHRSPPVVAGPDHVWTLLENVPLPMIGLFSAPDGALLASTPDGLYRSDDGGSSWTLLVSGAPGQVTQMTFDDAAHGHGWAGGAGGVLLRTNDGGRTWHDLPSPFGILPLVALQAQARARGESQPAVTLVAATYDARRQALCLWRSDDGGARWQRGAESAAASPAVATLGAPPLIAIGNVITVQHADGAWRQSTVGERGVRRVVGDGGTLVALAADGLWRSDDHGASWTSDDIDLPVDEMVDVALDAGTLFVLLSGGRLWSRPLRQTRNSSVGAVQ